MLSDGLINNRKTLNHYKKPIDILFKEEPRFQPYEELSYEIGFPYTSEPFVNNVLTPIVYPDFTEAQIRNLYPTTRLALLKAAVDLKEQQLTGPYPENVPQDILPEDPYLPGKKIRYYSKGERTLFHSVGPGKNDNKGAIIYDSTNGTHSPGDIVLHVR